MRTRNIVFNYLVIVGLPLLGVLGVLQVGAGGAPPPVGGTWRIEAELEANAATPCAASLSGFSEPVIRLAQSGVFIEVRLPNPSADILRGKLEGDHLVAEAKPSLFGDDVFGLLRISATSSREDEADVLRGLISMPRRVECVAVPFKAVRESAGREIRGIH